MYDGHNKVVKIEGVSLYFNENGYKIKTHNKNHFLEKHVK